MPAKLRVRKTIVGPKKGKAPPIQKTGVRRAKARKGQANRKLPTNISGGCTI